jgi:hypothetical protein
MPSARTWKGKATQPVAARRTGNDGATGKNCRAESACVPRRRDGFSFLIVKSTGD